jgi:hypothetical protein
MVEPEEATLVISLTNCCQVCKAFKPSLIARTTGEVDDVIDDI